MLWSDRREEGARERFDLARSHAQPVVRGGAGDRERGLGRIETIELVFGDAVLREAALVAQTKRPVRKKIGVQRYHDPGALEVELRLQRSAESDPRPLVRRVVCEWIESEKACVGKRGEDLRAQRFMERRSTRLDEKDQPRSAVLAKRRIRSPHFGEKSIPRARAAEVLERARALRIVEVIDRRLLIDPRRAEARGMVGVPLDLDRPPLAAGHEEPHSAAADRHRRRVVKRQSRRHSLGLARVRKHRRRRLAQAPG